MEFRKSNSDHTLFIRNISRKYVAILVYVDDIIIASNDDKSIEQIIESLGNVFKLRNFGDLKYFLGLEIARSLKRILVCQRIYALELLDDAGLLAAKPSSIPMEPSIKLKQDGKEDLLDDPFQYRRLVGKLMYLTITRPDITFAVNILCQFSSAPRISHMNAAYVKGSIGLGLFYSVENNLSLTAFTYADWASCRDTRRSTSGYCMFLGSSLISWKTKKQQIVSLSSAESEYRVMRDGVKEVTWLVQLLEELQVPQNKSVAFFCDSTAAIHIANNQILHERTKHLELDCHKVREVMNNDLIKPLHVKTEHQIVDVLTKPLFPGQFNSLISKIVLISIYLPS